MPNMNMGEIEWGLQGKEVGRGRMGRDVGRVWRGREGELSISRGGGCQVMERKVELRDTRRSTFTKNKNIKKKLDEGINLTKDFFSGRPLANLPYKAVYLRETRGRFLD